VNQADEAVEEDQGEDLAIDADDDNDDEDDDDVDDDDLDDAPGVRRG
jgi:hypothetical protein